MPSVKLQDWLLTEKHVRAMLGFKNSWSFRNVRRALGLTPIIGANGLERYARADVERVIAEKFGSAAPANNNLSRDDSNEA